MFVASLICTVRFSISPLIMLFSFTVAFTWYLIFAAYAVVITRPSPITPIRIIVNKRILLLLLNISSFMKVYPLYACLLYTSDAADEEDSVDLGGRRIIKKKNIKAEELDKSSL